MKFEEVVQTSSFVLMEGSLLERLCRYPGDLLDPFIANTRLIYSATGRDALQSIYRHYLYIGRDHDLPMIMLSPTWRANPVRLRAAGFNDQDDVNGDAVRFASNIREEYGSYARKIFLGGLMGCHGDAYRPEEAMPEDQAASFHQQQAIALQKAGVDFLIASTMPAISEARGMARAMSACDIPYIISFVIRSSGRLLDHTPLHEAISGIDAAPHAPPLAYMVNCVHPSVFAEALTAQVAQVENIAQRIVGLQANTSTRNPEELDNLDFLDSQSPAKFAEAMQQVHQRWGTRILGGCCGTDQHHLRAIAEKIVRS